VNGTKTSAKVVQDMARTFSIQIDNLCQFLPQDKVVEFAAMTPIELLKSTQQAAAPPEMLRWHEDLKKLRAHQREICIQNKSDLEQLANLENRQEMNRVDVERMKEKVVTEKRLGWLERCRPIPHYAESKRKANEARMRAKELSAELKKLKEELQPALKRVNAKELYLKQVENLKLLRKKEVADAEKQCDEIEAKMGDIEDKMKECGNRADAEKKSRGPKREELVKIQRLITQIKTQMEETPEQVNSVLINQQVQEKVERKRELEEQVIERTRQITTLKAQGEDRNRSVAELKKRLADLDTQAGQQQGKLERMARDTYRAWQWIQSHRDEFEREVFGPPMISCSLKDPKMADVMESFFQQNDTKIITVQTKNDFILLQQKLTIEMKLHDISLRVCSVDSLDDFRPPMSNERLQDLGLESWAIDQMEGPPTVLAMLCMEKFLHQSAVSSREISDRQYNQIVDAGIKNFVAGKTFYQVTRRAEYGAAGTSSKTRTIRPASIWTNQPVDANAKARLMRDIGEIGVENQQIKAEFDKLRADNEADTIERTDLVNQIETLKKEKEAKQKALMAYKALPARLAQQEEKLAAVQENLAGVKERCIIIQREKDKYLIQAAQGAIDFATAIGILREKSETLLEAEMLLLEAQSDSDSLKKRNEGIRDTLKAKEREEAEAIDVSKREIAKAKEMVDNLKAIRKEGIDLEEKEGDDGLTRMMQDINEKNTSSEELEAEIDSLKGKLDLIQGVGGNVIKEFEERAERIEKLRGRVAKARKDLGDARHGIREIRNNWEPKLEELVARISEKFGESFARIGCAGEVVVFKASSGENDEDDSQRTLEGDEGNGLDFANWAIHISVRFRENEPLSLLDSHRQSGGERAVSTIFYLMALQSLSRAPFRVVDEINQGMDPRNERMVHGRMVDIATPKDGEEGSGSQYFLITPKLLSGLKYRRGMTVLCIVSGENMPAAVKDGEESTEVQTDDGESKILWRVDFSKFVERARKLGLRSQAGGLGAGGKRIDTGMGRNNMYRRVDAIEV
jgi:structural maintenance of chromosomes protein 5